MNNKNKSNNDQPVTTDLSTNNSQASVITDSPTINYQNTILTSCLPTNLQSTSTQNHLNNNLNLLNDNSSSIDELQSKEQTSSNDLQRSNVISLIDSSFNQVQILNKDASLVPSLSALHLLCENSNLFNISECNTIQYNYTELMYVKCLANDKNCLIDTGSSVSLFPYNFNKDNSNLKPTSIKLFGANGLPIIVQGIQDKTLKFNQNLFTFDMFIANVKQIIIGLDFLKFFKLNPIPHDNILQDTLNNTTYKCSPSNENSFKINAVNNNVNSDISEFVDQLLVKFPNLLSDKFDTNILHKVECEINLNTDTPVQSKQRYYNNSNLQKIKDQLQILLDSGILQVSSSNFSSPIVAVNKPDNSIRICGDYRALNKITTPDKYPLPNISHFNSSIAGSVIFSKIDLKSAFHQIPFKQRDRHKTAILSLSVCVMPHKRFKDLSI